MINRQDDAHLKSSPMQEREEVLPLEVDDAEDSGSPAGLRDALRWAIDSSLDPAMASADWLAMDIDPHQSSAIALVTSPDVSLVDLRRAKEAFKTMRIMGETTRDRRIGARLYAAAIAAALVRHGKRISRQSDTAIDRALTGLLDDQDLPRELQALAGSALCILRNSG
jgi:hypothetical protein